MLTGLDWLALEAKYVDRAREFYTAHLDLPVRRETETDVVFEAGETELRLRRPSSVPRGGLHTHYAFSTPPAAYDDWRADLAEALDLTEHEFGSSRSLYFDDPDGHCVEIGGRGGEGAGITGIFEIVLEVEDIDRAEAFYTALGMTVMDRGTERKRVRLDAGPVEFELWEPQLGIADARGGVHVDVGLSADDPAEHAERVADDACGVTKNEGEVRIRDRDGHYLTLR